ncbi:MAG: hypothetical protein L0H74_05730 [Brachybacterium sp.]|nr:hypothetical protein [Brachybacterium sp.]MDN5899551.1 hypothetical protein [Brachybacterium sp.]
MSPSLREEMRRRNFAGREVTLAEGALVVGGATVVAARGGRTADAVVLAGIGTLGLVDDLLEPRLRRAGRPVSKGLRGHLGALRTGHLTTGAAKALGIPLVALGGALAAPSPRGGAIVVADAALIAGCANLANLLDLRPGRALKAVLPAAILLALGSPEDLRGNSGRHLALAAAVPGLLALPADLRERGMLGDAGANVLGASVGGAATRRLPVPARLSLLGVVVALNLVSERVSFSAVIERCALLRSLDGLGRLPVPAAAAGRDEPPSAPGAGPEVRR